MNSEIPMKAPQNLKTGKVNGAYWGARSNDWANIQEKQFSASYQAVLDHTNVGPATKLLDAGCGAGMAVAMAAEKGAGTSGIDASQALLAIAQTRVPNGDFRTGDIEDLPFEDAVFDIVTGFNSFQYAGNPTRALAEARRVVKPGGTVVIVTWGLPQGMEAATLVMALKPLLPPPPPGAPGPFALSDEDTLRSFASDAGLKPITLLDGESPWVYSEEATAIRGLGSSGVAARAMETSGTEAVDAAHALAIAPFRKSDGSYCINASYRCLIAQR